MLPRTIIGVDSDMSPEVPYAKDSYWTLDKNLARWDIFRQPTNGAWTGQTDQYGQGFPLQLAPTEDMLLTQIDAIASAVKPVTKVPKDVNPFFPFKQTRITPKYAPGSGTPVALMPSEMTKNPPTGSLPDGPLTPTPLPATQKEVEETNYLLIGSVAAVAALLFFGTLKVK